MERDGEWVEVLPTDEEIAEALAEANAGRILEENLIDQAREFIKFLQSQGIAEVIKDDE
jgi:hypothetical protein